MSCCNEKHLHGGLRCSHPKCTVQRCHRRLSAGQELWRTHCPVPATLEALLSVTPVRASLLLVTSETQATRGKFQQVAPGLKWKREKPSPSIACLGQPNRHDFRFPLQWCLLLQRDHLAWVLAATEICFFAFSAKSFFECSRVCVFNEGTHVHDTSVV